MALTFPSTATSLDVAKFLGLREEAIVADKGLTSIAFAKKYGISLLEADWAVTALNAGTFASPGAPTGVTGTPAAGGLATVAWTAPASDGGSPILHYLVTTTPATQTYTVDQAERSLAISGLTPTTSYTVSVEAVNQVGTGAAGTSAAFTAL